MKIITLSLVTLIVSCSHSTHLVHMSDHSVRLDQTRGKSISVETKQHTIMGIVFDTDYVNQARAQLIKKCPKGSITNIVTRYSTSHGFFSWYNKIYMQARCF